MNITIRMLRPEEFEDVLDMISEVFPDVDVDVCEEDTVLLAESGGRPVGFVHASEDEKRIVLQGIGVEQSARGQGIGTALLERLLEIYSRSDKPMVLHTKLDNPALELYHNFGFKVKRFGAVHLLERKCEN
jgi:ribosomal protein S18 acetylase RimI-like enzyme